MFSIEHVLIVIFGIVLVCAGLLGAAIIYHFSRFSPNHSVSVTTTGVYIGGIVIIMLAASVAMAHL